MAGGTASASGAAPSPPSPPAPGQVKPMLCTQLCLLNSAIRSDCTILCIEQGLENSNFVLQRCMRTLYQVL
jgi:hypothetical protein